jgi:hypothetical protein
MRPWCLLLLTGCLWGQQKELAPCMRDLSIKSNADACTKQLEDWNRALDLLIGISSSPTKQEFDTLAHPLDVKNLDPIDVPAISTKTWKVTQHTCDVHESSTSYPTCFTHEQVDGWTCKDKTRILMHDEQEPPKWYCHRAQTGGTQ